MKLEGEVCWLWFRHFSSHRGVFEADERVRVQVGVRVTFGDLQGRIRTGGERLKRVRKNAHVNLFYGFHKDFNSFFLKNVRKNHSQERNSNRIDFFFFFFRFPTITSSSTHHHHSSNGGTKKLNQFFFSFFLFTNKSRTPTAWPGARTAEMK